MKEEQLKHKNIKTRKSTSKLQDKSNNQNGSQKFANEQIMGQA